MGKRAAWRAEERVCRLDLAQLGDGGGDHVEGRLILVVDAQLLPRPLQHRNLPTHPAQHRVVLSVAPASVGLDL